MLQGFKHNPFHPHMSYSTIKRNLVLSAVLAVVPFGAARAEQVRFDRPFAPAARGWVQESEQPFREEICLNGRWDFQAVPVPADFVRNVGKPPALTLRPRPGMLFRSKSPRHGT